MNKDIIIDKIIHTIGINALSFTLIVLGVWIIPRLPEVSLSLLLSAVYMEMWWLQKLGLKVFEEEEK